MRWFYLPAFLFLRIPHIAIIIPAIAGNKKIAINIVHQVMLKNSFRSVGIIIKHKEK